jgi:mono/diheme cytochrome c family protein
MGKLSLALIFSYALLAADTTLPPAAQSVVDKSCAGCHQGSKAPAGLDLRTLAFRLDDPHSFGWWVRVHDAVEKGLMPPGGKAALSDAGRAAFLAAIARPMVAHEQKRAAEHGRSMLRRLNRYEYENTVREILSAPWLRLRQGLPEDGVIARFNKVGQGLDVSHVQMSRYLDTAEQAIRLVLEASRVPSKTVRLYAREQRSMISRMKYSPFNNHPERATIPILGFDAQPEVIAEKAPMTVADKDLAARELEGFATTASTYIGNEYRWDGYRAPAGGRYKIRMNVFSIWAETALLTAPGNRGAKTWRPTRNRTSPGRTIEPVTLYALRAGDKRLLGTYDVTSRPRVHEIEVDLLPGEQIQPDAARLFRSRPGFTGNPDATEAGTPGVAYRWMEVEGPLDTPASREAARRLPPAEGTAADAARLLREFVARAYRRPAREEEIQRYLAIVNGRMEAGFPEAMIAGYIAVLCSPGFLYLEEKPGPLDSNALASRLSYFLWNAPPDAQLRKVTPATLRAEAKRLLDDLRSRHFINAFLDYWLDLRKLTDNTPDQTLYPESYLDDLLMESALAETQLFVDKMVRENVPVANLVDSRFTFLNSKLAQHYGLPPVEGIHMRDAWLPADSVRGGLLTQASVLTVTANGTTTSPVLRGVWILERILGDPPPPPPPGVGAVEPDTRGATTIREQLDRHRADASCAACHRKIDPPGFALESFDVVGATRDRYRSTEEGERVTGFGKNGWAFEFRLGKPVDASGVMPTGESFRNVTEFKRLLLQDRRQIARTLAKHLVTYATGAPPSFADRPEIERILDAAERDGNGMRSLIFRLVESRLFTSK